MNRTLIIFHRDHTAYALEHIFIPLLLLAVFGLVFFILYYRLSDDKQDKTKGKEQQIVELFLIRYFFEGLNTEERKAELDYIKNNVVRKNPKTIKLLIEHLIHIKKNILETPNDLVQEIVDAFDLFNTFNRQIKFGNNYQKIIAIQHSQTLHNHLALPYLKSHLTSKQFEIRSNVLKAMVVASNFDTTIIANYPEPLKEVELLMLAELYQNRRESVKTEFNTWLDSQNENLIQLCLMIAINLNIAIDNRKLQLLILHENKKIASQALMLLLTQFKEDLKISDVSFSAGASKAIAHIVLN